MFCRGKTRNPPRQDFKGTELDFQCWKPSPLKKLLPLLDISYIWQKTKIRDSLFLVYFTKKRNAYYLTYVCSFEYSFLICIWCLRENTMALHFNILMKITSYDELQIASEDLRKNVIYILKFCLYAWESKLKQSDIKYSTYIFV